jgi:polar amino acid transport system substrate-binding protein
MPRATGTLRATPPLSVTPTPQANPSAIPTLASIAPASPSAALLAELATPGTLTVCLSVVGAPAAGLDVNGVLVGYNVDFAREVGRRLGLPIDSVQPLFDDLLNQVENHACDISVSSQNITAAREALVSFVAYSKSIQPVLVRVGDGQSIKTLTDLCGLAVSANAGTTHVDLIQGTGDYVGQGLNAQCTAAGKQPVDLYVFQTETDAVSALLDGRVQAYLGNPNFVDDHPNAIEAAVATLPPARQGITVAKDHPNLLAAVQAAMAAMIADGSYRAILAADLQNPASVALVSIE